jgi:hypothetical protein
MATRKKGFIGTRVLVCGHPVSKELNLICHLPASLIHTTHVALGVGENNVLVLVFREQGKRDATWQAVEIDQNEQSMSERQP